jgi:hypothetical protein
MDWKTSRSIETKIARLGREITEIDEYFYSGNEDEDRLLYAGMLERKRDDIVRSAVLQLHTAIEDLLNSYIICDVLNTKPEERSRKKRGHGARALRRMLFGAGSMGFDMKLNFALTLRLITKKTKDKLMLLNTIRNKCSHNWLLKAPVRHGKRPKQKKPPLLLYEGRDLHNVAVLKEFADEYGKIYIKLFVKYLGR